MINCTRNRDSIFEWTLLFTFPPPLTSSTFTPAVSGYSLEAAHGHIRFFTAPLCQKGAATVTLKGQHNVSFLCRSGEERAMRVERDWSFKEQSVLRKSCQPFLFPVWKERGERRKEISKLLWEYSLISIRHKIDTSLSNGYWLDKNIAYTQDECYLCVFPPKFFFLLSFIHFL